MIQVSKIIEGAKAATGLSNFGPDGWQEGLEILTDSANREADLNEMGVASFIGQCTMFLMRRLEIEDWYARHPEIDEEQIVAPLLVLGLPRTGSTALHCQLGEDPNVRVLRNWECVAPLSAARGRDLLDRSAHCRGGGGHEAARPDDPAHEADAAQLRDLADRGPADHGL